MGHVSFRWLAAFSLSMVLSISFGVRAADAPVKPPADPYPVGARVEVRRNNQWLPATIVKRDGTKAFVKFDGASDSFNEWVEGPQMREASVVTATGPGATIPGLTTPAASTRSVAATKPATKPNADPFAVGADIEAIFQGHWADAKVISRSATGAEVLVDGAFKETLDASKIRVRGVTQEEATKLSSQQGLFKAGSKVEYKWGGGWYDGVITRRNETQVEVKTSDGFTHRGSPGELRTRAVAPPLPQPPAPVETASTSGATGAPGVPAAPTPPAAPGAPTLPSVPLVDQSKMVVVSLAEAGGGLRAKPDPATQPAKALATAAPIFLPPMNRAGKVINGRVARILVTPGTTRGFVEYLADGRETLSEICRIDFATGIVGPGLDLPAGMVADDISPDGKRVLLRHGDMTGANLIQICSLDARPGVPAMTKISEFQPFGTGMSNKVVWGNFIDADHIVCALGSGNLIMVEVPTLRAIWTMDGMSGSIAALSPGRNLIACASNAETCLLEPLTGKMAQILEGTAPWYGKFSFSPDGRRVASVGATALVVWDLQAQDQPREIVLAGKSNHRLDWLSDEFVIVGGHKLVDLEKRLVTWNYLQPDGERPASATCAAGGKFWYVTVERPANAARRQIVPVTLPDAQPGRVLAAMKPEELFLVHPGSKVTLQVNVGADGDQQQKIVAGLTDALKRAGLEVADGQPVVLEASTAQGESRQMVFRKIGAFGATEQVTVTPTILNLALKGADGKAGWSISGRTGDVYGMVSIKAGQSISDAVGEAQKPNFSFFMHPNVPSYVPVPREKEGLGESNLTAKGIEPAKVMP